MNSAYQQYLTKQAVGADIAAAANHFAGGMQYNVGKLKAYIGHHASRIEDRLVSGISQHIAAGVVPQFAPHVERAMQPHAIGEVIASPGVKDMTREHIQGAIDRHLGDALGGQGLVSGAVDALFGKRKQAHELYFAKQGMISNNASDSVGGMTPHAALHGASSQPILRPAFHVPPVAEWGAKAPAFTPATESMPALHGGKPLAPSIAHMLSKHAAGFNLFGSPTPKVEERAYMDPALAGKIVRAKAGLSRAKLMYGAGFKKLPGEEQDALLKAHDRYHRTLEDAALAGQGGY
jgi:hypothetical protein